MDDKIRINLVLVFFILWFPFIGSAETITIVADEWPPFKNAANSENEGYMIEVAREVFESRGYRFVYMNLPWKRAIADTRNGKFTGVVGASKTDASGFVFPSEELAQNYLSFYVRKGTDWIFSEPDSISSVVIATIAGYDYRKWLNDYIKEHRDNPAKVQVNYGEKPLEYNLYKLMSGRVDVVVDNESAIRYIAKQMGISDRITAAGYGTQTAYIYIAFSPNNSESLKYAHILSEGITDMRKNGRLQEILDRYGLIDWQKTKAQP